MIAKPVSFSAVAKLAALVCAVITAIALVVYLGRAACGEFQTWFHQPASEFQTWFHQPASEFSKGDIFCLALMVLCFRVSFKIGGKDKKEESL